MYSILGIMTLHNEDRELQIELTKLQIDHEHLTSLLMGKLAIEFGAIIGLASIFYGLYDKPIEFFIPIGLIILQFMLLISIYFTLHRYQRKREELKRRIEELRKQYLW